MEGINDTVDFITRHNQLCDSICKSMVAVNVKHTRNFMIELIRNAYIAGAEGTKGIGLNFSKEERANDYLKLKGFIQ